ncbi:hypothetical protein D3C81_1842050 [compost metagenome]
MAALFFLGPPGGYRLGDRRVNRFGFNWLEDIIDTAVADSLAYEVKIIMPANHNEFGVSGKFIDPGHQFHSVARFHHHVHDD